MADSLDVEIIACEKTPLLHASSNRTIKSRRCHLCVIGKILFAVVVVTLVYGFLSSIQKPDPSHAPLLHGPHPAFPAAGATLNYTKHELVHLDISQRPYWPISNDVGVWETLDGCHYNWNSTGKIVLARGTPDQEHNFVFDVKVSASSRTALDSVSTAIRQDQHEFYVRCLEWPGVQDLHATDRAWNWSAAVHVDVRVLVKPGTLLFGSFKTWTNNLGIEVAPGLDFESNHMSLRSRSGSLVGTEVDTFTPRSITLYSQVGSIVGTWSLAQTIILQTGDWRNSNAPINVDLIPKRWSSGPTTGGVLQVRSTGGDIDIRMPFARNKVSLRNTSIDISSSTGSISGTFVTGIHTLLETGGNGTIDAVLLPYFGLPLTSKIATSTEAGSTSIEVLSPLVDEYSGVQPLLDTRSEHTSASGNMSLKYPLEWAGLAIGVSDAGHVSVAGIGVDNVVKDDYIVVGRRGTGMGSRLDFTTHSGHAELVIE